ncbi:hypothetical protein SDC9_168967 [bioreactor metagenome]|uniref:Uncharacterized protein n=1 Tax=bioreactor metagenome TaxID=1076179 RepID=A0A645G3V8_9ZZZZ
MHHIANGTGDLETFGAWHHGGFDEQYLAAKGRPGKAGSYARDGGTAVDLFCFHEMRFAKVRFNTRRGDLHLGDFLFTDLCGHFSANGTDLAFQVADAGFTRVSADSGLNCRGQYLDLSRQKSIFMDLAR